MASFTYAGTLATNLDKVRFCIGDTNTTYRQFYDEEITAILTEETNDIETTVARLLQMLSQDPDRSACLHDGISRGVELAVLQRLWEQRSQLWRTTS